jgi:hypothetical protein
MVSTGLLSLVCKSLLPKSKSRLKLPTTEARWLTLLHLKIYPEDMALSKWLETLITTSKSTTTSLLTEETRVKIQRQIWTKEFSRIRIGLCSCNNRRIWIDKIFSNLIGRRNSQEEDKVEIWTTQGMETSPSAIKTLLRVLEIKKSRARVEWFSRRAKETVLLLLVGNMVLAEEAKDLWAVPTLEARIVIIISEKIIIFCSIKIKSFCVLSMNLK